MSDDWESTTKIGRGVRGGSSAGPTVIRGNANRAAALKNSGVAIGTEKKYATGNKSAGPSDGQRMTMVDRSDDVVAQKIVPREVKLAMADGRKNRLDREGNPDPVTQQQLADACSVNVSVIRELEDLQKKAQPPKYAELLGKASRFLGIALQGKDIGKQRLTKTQQAAVDARKKLEKEEAKKAKEEAKRIKEEEEAAAKVKEEEEAAAKAKEEEEAAATADAEEEEEEEEKPAAKGKGKAKADEEDEDE